MKYSFEKPTITKQSLEEQLSTLGEKLWQDAPSYADIQPPEPFDDDELDEVPTTEEMNKP